MNQVAEKKSAGLPSNMFEDDAAKGLGAIGQEDLALPFLKILGQLSPEVNKRDGKYVEGAEPGMIFNSVSGELYDGTIGISVIPCFYKLEYIEWKDRDKGAVAPVNVYPADSDIMGKTTRGDDGKDRLSNGNYVEETASHYVVICEEGKHSSALITMKSTQRKKSKKWNSMMMSLRAKKKDGQGFFKPAPFTQTYRLKTVLEKNNLGSWFGWEIEHIGPVEDQNVLQAAYEFYTSCKGGAVKVNYKQEENTPKTPF